MKIFLGIVNLIVDKVKWFHRRFAEAFAVVFFIAFVFLLFRPWLMMMDPEAGLMVVDRLERPVIPGLFTVMFFLSFYLFLFFSMPTALKYFYPEKGAKDETFSNDFNLMKSWQRLIIILSVFLLLLLVFSVMHWVLNK